VPDSCKKLSSHYEIHSERDNKCPSTSNCTPKLEKINIGPPITIR